MDAGKNSCSVSFTPVPSPYWHAPPTRVFKQLLTQVMKPPAITVPSLTHSPARGMPLIYTVSSSRCVSLVTGSLMTRRRWLLTLQTLQGVSEPYNTWPPPSWTWGPGKNQTQYHTASKLVTCEYPVLYVVIQNNLTHTLTETRCRDI